MKLKKRPDNGIWMLTHEGRRISTGERLKARAQVVAQQIVNSGERPDKAISQSTLADALRFTYETIWQHLNSEKQMRLAVNRLSQEHPDVSVSLVDYAWLQAFVKQRRDIGWKAASINRELCFIKKALGEYHKMGKLLAMPHFPYLSKPRMPKDRWITPEEQLALIDAPYSLMSYHDAEFMSALINVLVYTGARANEFLTSCRSGEADGDRIYFYMTKTSKNRSIPVHPSMRRELDICIDFLKKNPDDGYGKIQHRLKRVCDKAGIEGVTLHTFRHTCASRMVSAGVSLKKVAEWLGHNSVVTTERYAHLAPDAVDEGAAHVLPPVPKGVTNLSAKRA